MSEELYILHKKENYNEKLELCEKDLKEIESSGINNELLGTSNLFDMRYSGLPGRDIIDRADPPELIM